MIRLSRIFRADGRAVVIALDHGQFKHEATLGLQRNSRLSMPEGQRSSCD
jgi:DhnA family fructose-bisphosphate aldolase class Ia